MELHLPVSVRRRITYATAATLLVGGFAVLAKPGDTTPTPSDKPALSTPVRDESSDVQIVAHEFGAPAAEQTTKTAAESPKPRPKVTTYQVVEGDTIGAIADKFGLKSSTILWANEMDEDDLLQIGQELQIPAVDGTIHTVQSGDTLWGIAGDFDVDFTTIVAANPDVDAEALQPGQVLLVPGGKPVSRRLGSMVASRGGERQAVSSGSFSRWPLGGPITDWFGWRTHPVYGTPHYHDGIDIGVPTGTPVVSVTAGQVSYVGYLGGYGLTVKVDHGNDLISFYAHLSEATVMTGQWVAGGEQIALSGNTGTSTGPHLHFSVFLGGAPVDPIGWLP